MGDESTNSGVEGGESRSSTAPSSASREILTEEMRHKIGVFELLDKQYRTNPQVKQVMDKIINGEPDRISDIFKAEENAKKEEIRTAEGKGDTSEVAVLKNDLAQIRSAFDGMKQMLETNHVIGARGEIEQSYQNEFSKLASDAGFDKSFSGYSELYDLSRLESQKLATEFGLVVKDGNGNQVPDLLLGYKPELLKKAFDKAKVRLKSLGFDVVNAKRDAMVNEKRTRQNELRETIKSAFTSDQKLTRQEVKSRLNNLFEMRLRQKGLSLADLKD